MSRSGGDGSRAMKVVVLGAGLVGGPMAADLARDERFEVTVVDNDAGALETLRGGADIEPLVRDLSEPGAVTSVVSDCDLVVSAVPGFMGFRTLEAVIEAGCDVVDVAFFPEDPFRLDDLVPRPQTFAAFTTAR